MTENYPPAPPPRWDDGPLTAAAGTDAEATDLSRGAGPGQGTADVARDQAAGLGPSAAEAGKHAAGTAREQASNADFRAQ